MTIPSGVVGEWSQKRGSVQIGALWKMPIFLTKTAYYVAVL